MTRHAVVLALVAALLGGGCTSGDDAPGGTALPGTRPGLLVPATQDREPAPATGAYPTVQDPDVELALADLEGEVAIVNFWASWCGPCRDEQPDLNAAHAELADLPVAFLGVDFRQDSLPNAQAHMDEFDVPYASLYDPAVEVAAALGVTTIPATVVLDPQGRVVARLVGTTTTGELVALGERLAREAA